MEWNGPALDRLNNTLITGSVDVCFLVKLGGAMKYQAGEVEFGGTVEPVGDNTGWVTAIDAETGAVRWRYHAEKPVIAGVTPTAGGVTLTGDLAGNLLVHLALHQDGAAGSGRRTGCEGACADS